MPDPMPHPPFDGFPPQTLPFLRDLAANNDRTFFTARKATYQEAVLDPLTSLVADLAERLAEEGLPLGRDPKRAIFRVNRDVRFSNDKRPYKTNASAALTRSGAKLAPGVLYLHVEPTGSFVAAGFYHPEPADLQFMRERIVAKPAQWQKTTAALARADLSLSREDTLVRTPKGFENAAPDLTADLKLKSWVTSRPIAEADLADAALTDRILAFALEARPLLAFGWAALDIAPVG